MASDGLSTSLKFVLRWEGGFVDHKDDPGGRTNKGVTQKVYDGWRTRKGLAARDVKQIEDAEVSAIYEQDYWRSARCDLLKQRLDLVQFDTAVNMGVGRAVRFLQGAVGCSVDGAFGSGTAKAADECDVGVAIAQYCNAREAYYERLVEQKPRLATFKNGWMNRLNALRSAAGLPGFEASDEVDFGDASYIAKVPDLGEDPTYDF